MNQIEIKVSVCCITYNHAPFLKKCLDGFLLQQTSFPIEVIIHDDASTDGTQKIIEEYTSKHPDIFFPLLQKENQYRKGIRGMNAKFNFPRCTGKYIALCEGDDFWNDPHKLQKQVDFLEEENIAENCSNSPGKKREIPSLILQDFIRLFTYEKILSRLSMKSTGSRPLSEVLLSEFLPYDDKWIDD